MPRNQFAGFFALASTLKGVVLTTDASDTPTQAASLPTFRIYGKNGALANGTGTTTQLDSKTVTGASNATPIVITATAHGFQTGMRITVSGVLGNTAANGTFIITKVDADTFSLDGSTGNGAYTSGGTAVVTGAYRWEIAVTAANGFEAGENYATLFSYTVSSTARGQVHTFIVV